MSLQIFTYIAAPPYLNRYFKNSLEVNELLPNAPDNVNWKFKFTISNIFTIFEDQAKYIVI